MARQGGRSNEESAAASGFPKAVECHALQRLPIRIGNGRIFRQVLESAGNAWRVRRGERRGRFRMPTMSVHAVARRPGESGVALPPSRYALWRTSRRGKPGDSLGGSAAKAEAPGALSGDLITDYTNYTDWRGFLERLNPVIRAICGQNVPAAGKTWKISARTDPVARVN